MYWRAFASFLKDATPGDRASLATLLEPLFKVARAHVGGKQDFARKVAMEVRLPPPYQMHAPCTRMHAAPPLPLCPLLAPENPGPVHLPPIALANPTPIPTHPLPQLIESYLEVEERFEGGGAATESEVVDSLRVANSGNLQQVLDIVVAHKVRGWLPVSDIRA